MEKENHHVQFHQQPCSKFFSIINPAVRVPSRLLEQFSLHTYHDIILKLFKAIEAAIDEEVNIISMSFGFPAYERHLKGIQRAIGKAYSASILIFCAACNGGGNTSIAYPANQNEVICVNSANGLGIPSEYNPGEAQEGRDLCALGEAVKSSWPKLQQQRKSGTSIATPIAAALAAVVLDYFRQNMPDSDEFMVSKLQMRKGMLEVLVKLMGRKRSGYYYLDPGKLFNKREPNIYGSILSVLVNV